MITKKEKERKLKLILLIVMVNNEYARRKPFKNVWEHIAFVMEQVMWGKEFIKVSRYLPFEKGGIIMDGDNAREEIIINRKSTIFNTSINNIIQ